MSVINAISPGSVETKVSNYDRVNAWLLASILVFGTLVAILTILLTREFNAPPAMPESIVFPPIDPGGLDDSELVDPGAEFPEVPDPVTDPTLFDAVNDAVSSVLATSPIQSLGKNGNLGDGDGLGGPELRIPKPPGRPDDFIRWKINYELVDIATYSNMLRSAEIELGVISRSTNEIWRVSDIGNSNQIIATSRSQEQEAIYFVPTSEQISRWDRILLSQSELGLDDVILVHFYPAEIIAQMQTAELEALPAGKRLEDIARTEFKSIETTAGLQFQVESFSFK